MKYVLAPHSYHLSLITYLRKDDPFLDLKLFSKDELNKYVHLSVSEDALIYLIKNHHYSYEEAKTYLADIAYVNEGTDNKTKFLLSLKKELLDNNLLVAPISFVKKTDEIDVYGYSKHDSELSYLLNSLGLKPNFIHNDTAKKEEIINTFERIEEEVYFVLNEIATLLDNGVSIKDIFILNRNKEYNYYLNKFAPRFGYKLNINNSDIFYSLGALKEFLKLYKENKDLDVSLDTLKDLLKDDPIYIDIKTIVAESFIKKFTFEEQLDYLINKFKERDVPVKKFDNAVKVINNPTFLNGKYVFVIGFAQGVYPRSYKDDKFLNNFELNSINRLNAKDKTKLDSEQLIDFFNSDNTFVFSFSNHSLTSNYYPSPISKRRELNKTTPKLADSFYSEDVIKLIYSDLKDLNHFYKEYPENFKKLNGVMDINYNSYSNSYQYKARVYDHSSKIKLSTSSLELYSKCPFKYYLDRILKVDEDDETYFIDVGNLAHHLFEHMREENFGFEKEFAAKTNDLELKPSQKYILNHNIKAQIKTAIDAIKKREHYYLNPKVYNELRVKYNIDNNTYIDGVIDNLVTIDNSHFICVDYKTGNTKFDESKLKYGLSTQLPTYSLLVSSDERFKDLSIAGLYINNVLTTKIQIEQKEDELIPSYLKLNGKTIADLDTALKLDSSLGDSKSSFINGLAIKKDGCSLRDSSSLVSKETFDEYKNITLNLFKEMNSNLRNNNFDIHPYFKNERDNGCQYCPYKDICYVRKDQYKLIDQEENEDDE